MKKFALIALLVIGITQCCFTQLPTQYEYVDENCSAIVSDYTGMVHVSDNCGIVSLSQSPGAGEAAIHTTVVTIFAIDESGNESSMSFDLVLLDTIPPLMELDTAWVSHTDQEVMEMYKSFYGWIQAQGDIYNAEVAGRVDTFVLPDTTLFHMNDSMKIFTATIPILEYRMDEGYWAGETPDLTALFK